MDLDSLRTASTYINNLLLARGLLRNGAPIDFLSLASLEPRTAQKTRADGVGNDERLTITAQAMNLVHDMVLRRDKDQERQESIAQTLQSLRTDAAQSRAEAERLSTQNRMLDSKLVSAQTETRAAQSALHALESTSRQLRDEAARARTTVQQVRTQCANDVRKRDVQIQRLKDHLSAQQRGATDRSRSRGGLTSSTQSIAPRCTVSGSQGPQGAPVSTPSIEDAAYSLKQETTEFLTQLSAGLSDENDALISLIRRTLATLRELQGMPIVQQAAQRATAVGHRASMFVDSCESAGGADGAESGADGDGMVHVPPASCGVLSRDIQHVLDSLKDLLTNPSFAPIEEVNIREEEIHRLRDGWEKMENRWREAVHLMHGWRRRMMSGGTTIGLEELRLGLKLGDGMTSYGRRATDSLVSGEPSGLAQIGEGDKEEIDDEEGELQLQLPEDAAEGLPEIEEISFADNDRNNINRSPALIKPPLRRKSRTTGAEARTSGTNALQATEGNVRRSSPRTTQSDGQENAAPVRPGGTFPKLHTAQAKELQKRAKTAAVSLSREAEQQRASEAVTMSVKEKLAYAAEEARRASIENGRIPGAAPGSPGSPGSSRSSSLERMPERPVSRIPLDESTMTTKKNPAKRQKTSAEFPAPASNTTTDTSLGGAGNRAGNRAGAGASTRRPMSRQTEESRKQHAGSAQPEAGDRHPAVSTHTRAVSSVPAPTAEAAPSKRIASGSATHAHPAPSADPPAPAPGPAPVRALAKEVPTDETTEAAETKQPAPAPVPVLKRKRDTVPASTKVALALDKTKHREKGSGGRASGTSRRRSTLSPQELQELMGMA